MIFHTDITDEQKIILLLSNPFFSTSHKNTISTILTNNIQLCPDTIYSIAIKNGVTGFVYKNCKNFDIFSDEIHLALQALYKKTALKNILMLKETLAILILLDKNKIPVIPLKGASASDLLFNDFGVYPSGDIDILIHPSKLEEAKDVLCKQGGFKPIQELAEQDLLSDHYHLNLQKRNILLEVHWTLVKRYFTISPDIWWQDTEQFEWNQVPAFKLSIENYIIYNIFRLYDHCFHPLRFFSLLAGIIDHNYTNINWEKLLVFANRYQMKKLVVFTLRMLKDTLDVKIPERIEDQNIFGYQHIKAMILSGIFFQIQQKHRRMLFYAIFLIEPRTLLAILLKRIFPSKGELRLRYNLPGNSKKIYLYYLLNPFLLLFKKQENIKNA